MPHQLSLNPAEAVPLPIDHDMPLPTEIVDRASALHILGITERFGGDPDYALELFDRIGAGVLILAAEVRIARMAVPDIDQETLGISPKMHLMITKFELDDALAVHKAHVKTQQIINYLLLVDGICSGNIEHPAEAVSRQRLKLSEASGQRHSAVQSDIAAAKPLESDEPVPSLSDAEVVQIVTDNMDVGEVSRLTDSALNYLARVAVTSTIINALLCQNELKADRGVDYQEILGNQFLTIVQGTLLDRELSPSQRTDHIRSHYSAVIEIARSMAANTRARDYAKPDFYNALRGTLLGRDAYLGRLLATIKRRQQAAEQSDLEPSPEPEPEVNGVTRPDLEALIEQANELDGDWRPSKALIGGYTTYNEFSKFLVSGKNRHGLNMGGDVEKLLAGSVLTALIILNEIGSENYTNAEIEASIGGFAAARAALSRSFEAGLIELRKHTKQQSRLIFPDSSFLSGLRYLLEHREAMSRAVRAFRFGDTDRLITTLNSIFIDPDRGLPA